MGHTDSSQETQALIKQLTDADPARRSGVLDAFALKADAQELWNLTKQLHVRGFDENVSMYGRVQALMQAAALCRYHIPGKLTNSQRGHIPYRIRELVQNLNHVDAINKVLIKAGDAVPNDALLSVLAGSYYGHAFAMLAGQVQSSVRTVPGNRWMFRMGDPGDISLRVRPELVAADPTTGLYTILEETTPVRMDLTHTGWSDIFFLGMDYPEGARVLNISVDLGVFGRDKEVRPPISAWFRVIDEPVIRLVCVDLGAESVNTHIHDIFDFARDYTGLLKAAVIASGLVPSGLDGIQESLEPLLRKMIGPGKGFELASQVRDIPKGSRLAVSTNLLAGLISLCMRATSQVTGLTGELAEIERRIIAARAILGEWLGGSGGGWQDSGGIWPGIKLIQGVRAQEGDPEWGLSQGCLLPRHTILGRDSVPDSARKALQDSLVLVHGGMAANVGPILEMVTEKYLLAESTAWAARQELLDSCDVILDSLKAGDIRRLGALTTALFRGPLQTIIPWVSNAFTERLIDGAQEKWKNQFWGFWMLGGMSGGGMGFIFDPEIRDEAKIFMQEYMVSLKRELQNALPFAMDPVVYNFAINEKGSWAQLIPPNQSLPSRQYYLQKINGWLAQGNALPTPRRHELAIFRSQWIDVSRDGEVNVALEVLDRFLPARESDSVAGDLDALLASAGFDPVTHEVIRRDLRSGRIGLAQNRLPPGTTVEDPAPDEIPNLKSLDSGHEALGRLALQEGKAAIITLAGGAGSRWTQGAGTIKALHPFARFDGTFRNFLEVHRAKINKCSRVFGREPVHIVTTSNVTHGGISLWASRQASQNLYLSEGKSMGLRMVPTTRDLKFLWENMHQQKLEERKQKVRDSGRRALFEWAAQVGEASDYRDNLPSQCMHPVGHWYEVANLFLNGTLAKVLDENPQIQYFMLHNLDTLGAGLEPHILGFHMAGGQDFSWELISRRYEDQGGGLARVNGQLRLVEGMALPNEEDEARLSCYNSATCWITVDSLLRLFHLDRQALKDSEKVREAVRTLSARMPTYITIKDVKRRWGKGHEDVFPVSQWEKLWGDMSALPDAKVSWLLVDRLRGQQLKDPAQLDSWVRDGSRDAIERQCEF